MDDFDNDLRIARPVGATDQGPSYRVALTPKDRSDPVVLYFEPLSVLPVVFVPGIMGSNLCNKDKEPVWRLDAVDLPFLGPTPVGLAVDKFDQGAGVRQRDLHPDRTRVDDRGNVPKRPIGSVSDRNQFTRRGWGQVAESSYHAFLSRLEEILNGHRTVPYTGQRVEDQFLGLMNTRPPGGERDAPWRPLKDFIAPTPKEIQRMNDWLMPVYAFGYNWLDSNTVAAEQLALRIQEIIAGHQNGSLSFCKQVILITHSMGGLVARACAKLPGMETRIAGVVHGVMPAYGAAVAYRRCKVGMRDEGDIGAAVVIGWTGQHVTPVFAQAPGALQLLPNRNYEPGWLEIRGPRGELLQESLPKGNPYSEIYRRRDRWWGLIREEWLAPEDGVAIDWFKYQSSLDAAEKFHTLLGRNDYHANTYAFYGADDNGKTHSFERICWSVVLPNPKVQVPDIPLEGNVSLLPRKALAGSLEGERIDPSVIPRMTPQEVDLQGVNPEQIKSIESDPSSLRGDYEWTQYELRVGLQDGTGDGTVPASSGRGPADSAATRQVFRLTGLQHEPAYNHATARQVTVYSLIKIAASARWPQPFSHGSTP